ncbi:MAG: hypothetical protein JWO09_714 [Bacteroidetes bacterium]|nr:hypothetical protein [Bacteroidota bacterium]
MTEQEIAAYFRNRQGSVCGRMGLKQLQAVYTRPAVIKIPFHKRFFSYLLTFFVSNAVISKAAAQADTFRLSQTDTLQALRDSTHTDSLEIVSADTLKAEADTAEAISEKVPEEVIKIGEGFIGTVIISGDIVCEREGPTFLELLKDRFPRSMFRKEKSVELPVPGVPAKPQKEEESILTALLPEELRRKGIRKS